MSSSGELILLDRFDREADSRVSLVVNCTLSGRDGSQTVSSQRTLDLVILDLNDNGPTILQTATAKSIRVIEQVKAWEGSNIVDNRMLEYM